MSPENTTFEDALPRNELVKTLNPVDRTDNLQGSESLETRNKPLPSLAFLSGYNDPDSISSTYNPVTRTLRLATEYLTGPKDKDTQAARTIEDYFSDLTASARQAVRPVTSFVRNKAIPVTAVSSVLLGATVAPAVMAHPNATRILVDGNQIESAQTEQEYGEYHSKEGRVFFTDLISFLDFNQGVAGLPLDLSETALEGKNSAKRKLEFGNKVTKEQKLFYLRGLRNDLVLGAFKQRYFDLEASKNEVLRNMLREGKPQTEIDTKSTELEQKIIAFLKAKKEEFKEKGKNSPLYAKALSELEAVAKEDKWTDAKKSKRIEQLQMYLGTSTAINESLRFEINGVEAVLKGEFPFADLKNNPNLASATVKAGKETIDTSQPISGKQLSQVLKNLKFFDRDDKLKIYASFVLEIEKIPQFVPKQEIIDGVTYTSFVPNGNNYNFDKVSFGSAGIRFFPNPKFLKDRGFDIGLGYIEFPPIGNENLQLRFIAAYNGVMVDFDWNDAGQRYVRNLEKYMDVSHLGDMLKILKLQKQEDLGLSLEQLVTKYKDKVKMKDPAATLQLAVSLDKSVDTAAASPSDPIKNPVRPQLNNVQKASFARAAFLQSLVTLKEYADQHFAIHKTGTTVAGVGVGLLGGFFPTFFIKIQSTGTIEKVTVDFAHNNAVFQRVGSDLQGQLDAQNARSEEERVIQRNTGEKTLTLGQSISGLMIDGRTVFGPEGVDVKVAQVQNKVTNFAEVIKDQIENFNTNSVDLNDLRRTVQRDAYRYLAPQSIRLAKDPENIINRQDEYVTNFQLAFPDAEYHIVSDGVRTKFDSSKGEISVQGRVGLIAEQDIYFEQGNKRVIVLYVAHDPKYKPVKVEEAGSVLRLAPKKGTVVRQVRSEKISSADAVKEQKFTTVDINFSASLPENLDSILNPPVAEFREFSKESIRRLLVEGVDPYINNNQERLKDFLENFMHVREVTTGLNEKQAALVNGLLAELAKKPFNLFVDGTEAIKDFNTLKNHPDLYELMLSLVQESCFTRIYAVKDGKLQESMLRNSLKGRQESGKMVYLRDMGYWPENGNGSKDIEEYKIMSRFYTTVQGSDYKDFKERFERTGVEEAIDPAQNVNIMTLRQAKNNNNKRGTKKMPGLSHYTKRNTWSIGVDESGDYYFEPKGKNSERRYFKNLATNQNDSSAQQKANEVGRRMFLLANSSSDRLPSESNSIQLREKEIVQNDQRYILVRNVLKDFAATNPDITVGLKDDSQGSTIKISQLLDGSEEGSNLMKSVLLNGKVLRINVPIDLKKGQGNDAVSVSTEGNSITVPLDLKVNSLVDFFTFSRCANDGTSVNTGVTLESEPIEIPIPLNAKEAGIISGRSSGSMAVRRSLGTYVLTYKLGIGWRVKTCPTCTPIDYTF